MQFFLQSSWNRVDLPSYKSKSTYTTAWLKEIDLGKDGIVLKNGRVVSNIPKFHIIPYLESSFTQLLQKAAKSRPIFFHPSSRFALLQLDRRKKFGRDLLYIYSSEAHQDNAEQSRSIIGS